MKFERISYKSLNARQKENYNFQKASGLLADYGYSTIRLSDDWNGADFIALHSSGKIFRVQLKGRLTFSKKYLGCELWVCFRNGYDWYFYPHDKMLAILLNEFDMGNTRSWDSEGLYTFPRLSRRILSRISKYRLTESVLERSVT